MLPVAAAEQQQQQQVQQLQHEQQNPAGIKLDDVLKASVPTIVIFMMYSCINYLASFSFLLNTEECDAGF